MFITQNYIRYEFFGTNYLKYSNSFLPTLILHQTGSITTEESSWKETIYIGFPQMQRKSLIRKKLAAQCKDSNHYSPQ